MLGWVKVDTPEGVTRPKVTSMTDSTTTAYTVRGMSCEHCKRSVAEEVGEIEGVERVEVDLASGRLEVQGVDISQEAVKAAVEDAGYQLAEAA